MTNSTALGNVILFGGIGLVLWRSSTDSLPHDSMAGTRVIDASTPIARR